MLQKTREQIGTAGLIVAIVALVAALGGGAYAASGGLTGKQKKEVKKIAKVEAKKYAKRGKRGRPGKNGQNGTNGAPGAKGATGAPGAKGATGAPGGPGAPGAPGEGVTIKSYLGEECPTEEGTEFSNATGTSFACNGEDGETGFTSTLPSGKTEHGTWSVGPFPGTSAAFETYVPLSLNIPLAQSELAVHYLTEEEGEEAPASPECPGSYEAPAAAGGNLCVYTTEEGGTTFKRSRNAEALTESAGPSGTLLRFELASATSKAYGTWVVTAP